MPLQCMEHFLIQVDDLEKAVDWYGRVLGLEHRDNPDFKFPVAWMYLGDTPVLHLTLGGAKADANRLRYLGQQSEAEHGSGVVDHIAFRATGLPETMKRLDAEGIDYTTRQASKSDAFQIFMIDPWGVKFELNFANDEVTGVEPELLASAM